MVNLPSKTVNGIEYKQISDHEWIRPTEYVGSNTDGVKKGEVLPGGTIFNPDLRAIYQMGGVFG